MLSGVSGFGSAASHDRSSGTAAAQVIHSFIAGARHGFAAAAIFLAVSALVAGLLTRSGRKPMPEDPAEAEIEIAQSLAE